MRTPGTGPEWPLDNLSLLLETPKEQIPSRDDLPENQVMVLNCRLIGFNFFQSNQFSDSSKVALKLV